MKYLIFSRSTTCAACDSVKGHMKAHDIEYTELKADVDQLEAMKHRVRSVPTTIRFDSDGLEVNRIAGFQIDEARKFFK
jgi:thioredoxin-related protein